jgi:hypothetical protein
MLYLVNSALLFTHEVDSGYWQEWQLFDLPGGIQMFLVMNFVLVIIGLLGFKYVVLQRRAGVWFSLVQAASGVFAPLFIAFLFLRVIRNSSCRYQFLCLYLRYWYPLHRELWLF